ncbi:MAG: IS66 family transposase, partial [Stellaceae bacterium]
MPPPELASLFSAEKDALILTLLARVEELAARGAALEAEKAALRARLALPPKTPDNSGTPPAQGHKANAPPPGRRGGGKAHAGAPRPLHPNPPRRRAIIAARCRYCRADVSGAGQGAKERYDRIETPQIQPEVTRVTLYGGVCPCCA